MADGYGRDIRVKMNATTASCCKRKGSHCFLSRLRIINDFIAIFTFVTTYFVKISSLYLIIAIITPVDVVFLNHKEESDNEFGIT